MRLNLRFMLVVLPLVLSCGGDSGTGPSDTIPPARVSLSIHDNQDGRVTLTWTAPGDDDMEGRASRYDIRYLPAVLTEASWDSAVVVESPPVPSPAGEVDTLTITGLAPGIWYFCLKAADDAHNWSPMSNVVSPTVSDFIPPDRITDLAVRLRGLGGVTLTWSAPSDDSVEGQASIYDIRYALMQITEETWDDASKTLGLPAPGPAGTQEQFGVKGLDDATEYFFAIKAGDAMRNWSPLSNGVGATSLAAMRLTMSPGPPGAYQPAWSPDGQSIAYTAQEVGVDFRHVYIVPATGGPPVRLTSNRFEDHSASWSPDGERIVFVSEPAEFSNPTALWVTGATPGSELELLVNHETRMLNRCAWSPDGTRIAYEGYWMNYPDYVSDIFIVSVDDGTAIQWSPSGILDYSPAWSPDGTRIAFSSNRSGDSDIWVKDVDGGDAVQLTDNPEYDSTPSWSPDGSRIAFVSRRDGYSNIWVMSSTGEDKVQLTYGEEGVAHPTWSPDGSKISFVRWDTTSEEYWIGEIWVLDLDS